MYHCYFYFPAAIAKNVAKWQEDKVQGKLEATKDNEEDIYSAARLADIQVRSLITVLCVNHTICEVRSLPYCV